jgi:hypothetical protein
MNALPAGRRSMCTMRGRLALLLTAPALLLPAGALAARAAPTTTYRGRTGSDVAVTVKVRDGRMTSFKTSVHASCGSTNLSITVAYPPSGRRGASAPIRNGSFSVTYRSDPTLDPDDDRRTLTGRLGRGGRLSGTIRVAGLCSAEETYSARRG